jgi:ketosteroid isomerase-like protein
MAADDVSGRVRRIYAAYESKDRQVVEDLVGEDFTFTSPYDDHIDRAAYFERCWPYSAQIRAMHIEKLFVEGNEAFVRYRIQPQSGAPFRNTEYLRFEGGKLAEVEVYFGSLPNQ